MMLLGVCEHKSAIVQSFDKEMPWVRPCSRSKGNGSEQIPGHSGAYIPGKTDGKLKKKKKHDKDKKIWNVSNSEKYCGEK